jgi:hypothetical protein
MKLKTLLSITFFIPLAGILLITLACLPAPVGDPETAKVDPALVGAWQLGITDPASKEKGVVTMRALDAKTYFVQYLFLEVKDGKEVVSVLDHKGWLTSLAGATFITCESLDDAAYLVPGEKSDRYYWVAKLERSGDTVTLSPVNESSPLMKDKTTRDQIETVIKANVNNKELYSQTMTFKKLGKDQLTLLGDLRKKANVGINAK